MFSSGTNNLIEAVKFERKFFLGLPTNFSCLEIVRMRSLDNSVSHIDCTPPICEACKDILWKTK